jgi:hypothetical protein
MKFSHKTQSQLAVFFAEAGKFVRSRVREEGTFPKRKHVTCFDYERGYAEFDGQHWALAIW